MPSNGVRLSREQIVHINNWIMGGAKDQFGNVPSAPDAQPVFLGFQVYDTGVRIDSSNRINGQLSPIRFDPGKLITFFFIMTDDNTLPSQMKNVKIKMSTLPDDFSSAIEVSASWLTAVWVASINSSSFQIDKQYYFRFYFNDGKHPTDAEFPRNDNLYIYKEYASFIVK
jgi:hypothetical protein